MRRCPLSQVKAALSESSGQFLSHLSRFLHRGERREEVVDGRLEKLSANDEDNEERFEVVDDRFDRVTGISIAAIALVGVMFLALVFVFVYVKVRSRRRGDMKLYGDA